MYTAAVIGSHPQDAVAFHRAIVPTFQAKPSHSSKLTISYLPENLPKLAAAERAAKVTPLRFELREAGLERLAEARDCDALVLLASVPQGRTADLTSQVAGQIAALTQELCISDLQIVESALAKLRKVAAAGDETARRVLQPASKLTELLEEEQLSKARELSLKEGAIPKDWGLLCTKAIVAVISLDEADLDRALGQEATVAEALGENVSGVVLTCLPLEAELRALDASEAEELRLSYGLEVPLEARLAAALVDALDLAVFYTVNENEARAWAVPKGTTAWEAAGKIHSDMQRGFIKAEVLSAEDLLAAGSLKEARAKGICRLEGKGYEVRPEDVLWIRFSA
jgi:ribosome-binding ATPase